MTYDIDAEIQRIKSSLAAAEQKLNELEQTGQQAQGKLSTSFIQHIADLEEQKSRLLEHLSSLKQEKFQSWQQSNFGNDLVKVAQNLISDVEKLVQKLSAHK